MVALLVIASTFGIIVGIALKSPILTIASSWAFVGFLAAFVILRALGRQ